MPSAPLKPFTSSIGIYSISFNDRITQMFLILWLITTTDKLHDAKKLYKRGVTYRTSLTKQADHHYGTFATHLVSFQSGSEGGKRLVYYFLFWFVLTK
jgi:hypothetical protein